jgi:putative FmdB family regulatory protein
MPIYGYECTECEHTFDALQKMSDPKLVDCPECGESSLRKQLSAPKFRLKGKGWYETDFKTGDKRNLAGEAAKKPETKSKEADKPAKKTETKKPTDSKAKSA